MNVTPMTNTGRLAGRAIGAVFAPAATVNGITTLFGNWVESSPSSLSALRFGILVVEFTANGAWPEATFKASAVALLPVLKLLSRSVRSLMSALRVVRLVAVL